MSYTPELTASIVLEYVALPNRDTVDALALKYNKPTKSIIGKLSHEGVYRRESYKTKQGETPITKIEIVHSIAHLLNIDPDILQGLDKPPKSTLKLLEQHMKISISTI